MWQRRVAFAEPTSRFASAGSLPKKANEVVSLVAALEKKNDVNVLHKQLSQLENTAADEDSEDWLQFKRDAQQFDMQNLASAVQKWNSDKSEKKEKCHPLQNSLICLAEKSVEEDDY